MKQLLELHHLHRYIYSMLDLDTLATDVHVKKKCLNATEMSSITSPGLFHHEMS